MTPKVDSKLIEKIRNLLKLADTSRGATPAEAAAAMAKAQQLITKNKIDLMLLEETPEEHQDFGISHEYVVMDRTQRYDYDSNIARILNECFGVKVLWAVQFANGKRCHCYLLIGQPQDIALARMAIPIFRDALYRGVMRYLRERGEKWTAFVAHGFYLGIELGYVQGSEQGRARAMAQMKKHDADRFAIVLVNKDNAIAKYSEEVFKPKKIKSPKKPRPISNAAFARGYEEGKQLDVSGTKLQDSQP
jgi:hypothetical protein